jgi:ornithine cyclodeaminase
MRVVELEAIRRAVDFGDAVGRMRDALIAHSAGLCDTPMPMHLDIPPRAEVHIKSSYRRGGEYFALKIAGTFPGGESTSAGMMLLSSAETGQPVAFLADSGYLTDVRTAAVAAMIARELGRDDRALGILGTGVQARLLARVHCSVLPLERIVLWGRSQEHAEACRREVADVAEIAVACSPADVASQTKLIATATSSRTPLLRADDIQPGSHISAIGADSPGKQELDPEILRRASLLLVDSRAQCERLGELQHAPEAADRALEIGSYCAAPREWDRSGVSVCDFTGLGVEDLYIAEYCYERCVA